MNVRATFRSDVSIPRIKSLQGKAVPLHAMEAFGGGDEI
jgi:hypothetical protein